MSPVAIERVPRRRRVAGLTLIEIMIVVAVLALLATIAYPIYERQTLKARRAEAKSALEAIAQAQERFFSARGVYSTDLRGELGNSPAVDRVINLNDCSSNSSCSTFGGYYTVTLNGNNTAFDLTAALAGPRSDTICGDLMLDEQGLRTAAVTNNTPKCW